MACSVQSHHKRDLTTHRTTTPEKRAPHKAPKAGSPSMESEPNIVIRKASASPDSLPTGDFFPGTRTKSSPIETAQEKLSASGKAKIEGDHGNCIPSSITTATEATSAAIARIDETTIRAEAPNTSSHAALKDTRSVTRGFLISSEKVHPSSSGPSLETRTTTAIAKNATMGMAVEFANRTDHAGTARRDHTANRAHPSLCLPKDASERATRKKRPFHGSKGKEGGRFAWRAAIFDRLRHLFTSREPTIEDMSKRSRPDAPTPLPCLLTRNDLSATEDVTQQHAIAATKTNGNAARHAHPHNTSVRTAAKTRKSKAAYPTDATTPARTTTATLLGRRQ